jgi:K(+)-stimulated pyrophosphate-energized sodium pump
VPTFPAAVGDASYPINVADPRTFIGASSGGSIVFLFSVAVIRPCPAPPASWCRRSAASSARSPGSWTTPRSPDYGPVIDICTSASLRELATPALLAVLMPVVIGFGLGYLALGGFLASDHRRRALMANFLSNSGGAWDNAKKYIEDGNEGGKGSESPQGRRHRRHRR